MWSPRQQDCLAIVRTRLPSEERKFSLSLPSLFILCAGFAWILFIPLPLGQEVPVYGLVSLKLIILGADCEHWVGGRDKGFVINFMSRGWEVWSCEHPARFGLLSGGAVHHIVFLVWLRSITHISFTVKENLMPHLLKRNVESYSSLPVFVLFFASLYVTHEKASHLVPQPRLAPPTNMKSDFWVLKLNF